MHLRALSIGYAVPRTDFDARIHSVFRSALNLQLAGGTGLLTVLAASEGDLPQGILTDAPQGFTFEKLAVGTRVSCHDGQLRLDGSVSVDLKSARRWDFNLTSIEADLSHPATANAWRCAWDALNARQAWYGTEIVASDLLFGTVKKESPIFQQASQALTNILDCTRRYELSDPSGINDLIGLGIGLTPSGDDLLIGYLAGLWCSARRESKRLYFLSAFCEAVLRHSSRTNDISRTYLYHATRGYVSSRLVNLASAICSGADPQHVRDHAEAAMQMGHTSGMETVTGLLFGLGVWDMLPLIGNTPPGAV